MAGQVTQNLHWGSRRAGGRKEGMFYYCIYPHGP